MNRSRIIRIHATAGVTAFGLIACFFLASMLAEFSGLPAWIIGVKKTVFYGMWAMLILMPLTTSTGFKLAGRSTHPIIRRKRKRLRWIVLNALVLIGLATFLYQKATSGQLDASFMTAQGIEWVLGGVNLFLLGFMIRDGFRLRTKNKATSRPVVSLVKNTFQE